MPKAHFTILIFTISTLIPSLAWLLLSLSSLLAANVQVTAHMCEAAVEEGVDKFVHISSAAIYGSAEDLPLSEATAAELHHLDGLKEQRDERVAKGLHVALVDNVGAREE